MKDVDRSQRRRVAWIVAKRRERTTVEDALDFNHRRLEDVVMEDVAGSDRRQMFFKQRHHALPYAAVVGSPRRNKVPLKTRCCNSTVNDAFQDCISSFMTRFAPTRFVLQSEMKRLTVCRLAAKRTMALIIASVSILNNTST